MADEPRPKNDIKSRLDAFVAKVAGDPASPQQTLLLSGFLGASSEPNLTRIYSDETLANYIDVATDDIVHTEPRPKSESPLGGSYIWIKQSAEVLYGQAGTERAKAKFLEGPISAQAGGGAGAEAMAGAGGGAGAAGGGGAGAPLPVTIPLIACHPTLLVPQCKSIAPFHCATQFPTPCPPTHVPVLCPQTLIGPCPPTPVPHLCPSIQLHLCPPSLQHCPTKPILCPPITVNLQICVASGGGPGCPVNTPQTPQTPQGPVFGGAPQPDAAFAAPPAAGGPGQIAASIFCPSVFTLCPSVPVVNCAPSVAQPCPSVPWWRCPSGPVICQHTALLSCYHTIFEPQCIPIPTPTIPVASAACQQQPVAFDQQAFAAPAAAAPALPASQLPAACFTHASVCCPSVIPIHCPTTIPLHCPTQVACPTVHSYHCPTVAGYHCPSVANYQCPSVAGYHCPTPHCPTPHCPTQVCTEIGPHCNPTPNPVHCPTPNMMCPPVTSHCPSAGEICPTSSPLFCGTQPPGPQFAGGVAPEAAQQPAGAAMGAPGIQVQPTILWSCQVTQFCPVTVHHHFCGPSVLTWCPPHTIAGACYTPFCPRITAQCPPPQSIACQPGF